MGIRVNDAELYDVKLKHVATREGGESTGHEKWWLITFKVPCNALDANQLPDMIGEEIVISAEKTQLVLDLKNKPARAPVAGETNAAAPMQKAEAKAA
jgi:hypothetical protein